jgi:hypothetical protein
MESHFRIKSDGGTLFVPQKTTNLLKNNPLNKKKLVTLKEKSTKLNHIVEKKHFEKMALYAN